MKVARNISLTVLMLAWWAQPATARDDHCGDGWHVGGWSLHGNTMCGGGGACIAFDGSCTAWTCDDITQGIGVHCHDE